MTITGSGFNAESTATVDGNDCRVLSRKAAVLTCQTPAGSGAKQVKVITKDGTALTSSNDFTYDASVTPTVSSVTPTDPSAVGSYINLCS